MFERHLAQIPGRQRLSILIGFLLLSLVLSQFIELPTRKLTVSVFGSPLGIDLSSEWLMAILLAGLVCTGTDALVRTHPHAHSVGLSYTFVYWALPGLLGLVTARLLALAPTRALWVAGLVGTGLLFAVVLTAEYTTVDPLAPAYSQARLLLNTIAYAVAFALFVTVYGARIRSLVTVPAMLIVSFALALDLLWISSADAGRTAALAGAAALILGECSWAMNYWQISSWSGGIVLLLIFYVLTGIASQHLQGRLKRHMLIEYAIVAIAGTAVLIVFHP